MDTKHTLQARRVARCMDPHTYLQFWEKEVSLFSVLWQADEICQIRDAGMALAMVLITLAPPMPCLQISCAINLQLQDWDISLCSVPWQADASCQVIPQGPCCGACHPLIAYAMLA